jgi:hypothetical protein
MGKRQTLRVVLSPEGLNTETGAPTEGPRPRPDVTSPPDGVSHKQKKPEPLHYAPPPSTIGPGENNLAVHLHELVPVEVAVKSEVPPPAA